MVVMMIERVSPGVRGELTRWMLEPQAGVFIGNLSGMVRDKLWEEVCRKLKDGAAMMFHTANTEQGYDIKFSGATTREVVDFEGLKLIRCPPKPTASKRGSASKNEADT